MDDDQVARSIDNLEHAIALEDAAFVRRFQQVQRRDTQCAIVMTALLAVGAVLLAVGVGTFSLLLWTTGVATLLLAVAVHATHERRERRAR